MISTNYKNVLKSKGLSLFHLLSPNLKSKSHYSFRISSLFILFLTQISFSQKKDENIGTEVVNVVKPYSPTISDAFKVKETPNLDDEENTKKETINYNIFSFPVASTFTPSKGVASGVDKSEQERLYKNYFTFGFGTYKSAIAELFITENISENQYVSAMLRHQSSQGGIKNVPLDNKFSNTDLDFVYGNKQQNYAWKTDFGYQRQGFNWYGLPENFGSTLSPTDFHNLLNGINPKHIYQNLYLGGKISFNEGVFNEMSLKFNHFWDSYGSIENRFYAKPTFDFDVMDSKIRTNILVDYLVGSFKNSALITNYGYVNLGLNPNYVLLKDDLSMNLGVNLFFSMDNENNKNKFFVYPKVKASYKVVGDLMIAYAGAEGELKQNSYRDFSHENPFLSPTLNITPTDSQYDIYFGLKGKLANNIAYNVRGSYLNEKNKALFRSNNYSESPSTENFGFGNSFGVVYDNLKTISFFGELKANFSKTFDFGINATFSSYNSDLEQEAWNLPQISVSSNLDVNITSKWFAGANLFYVGKRKDIQQNLMLLSLTNPITLNGYFDANLNVGYKYNERLTAFLKANNIANQAYQKWLNFPVQQLQLVLGANYKFDF